jgi:hypothetical protein
MNLVNALGNLVMEGVTEQQIHQDEPRSGRLEPSRLDRRLGNAE